MSDALKLKVKVKVSDPLREFIERQEEAKRPLCDRVSYGVTLGAFTKVGRFSLEGGLFVYRSEFAVTVQRIHDPKSGYPEVAEYRIASYHNTPYLGIAYNVDDFYARLRVYQEINQDGETYPFKGLTNGPAIALTAGIRF